MKSGILAAETLFESLLHDDFSSDRLKLYSDRFNNSWAYDELIAARNYRKAFDGGLYSGLLQAGLQHKFPGLSIANGFGKQLKKKSGAASEKAEIESFTPDGRLTFCPAQVYEVSVYPRPELKLNPSNCLHCKTCETVDPYGIITWIPPQGGGGPGYKLS